MEKKKKTKSSEFNPIKEDLAGKRAARVKWTTKILNDAIRGIEQGKKLVANPFYENNTRLLKAELVYSRTKEEVEEWIRCKNDILYFANTYCKLMTPEGVKNITLRDYQQNYLRHLENNRLSIYLACRQCGKCVLYLTEIQCKNINCTDERVNKLLFKYDTGKGYSNIPLFELMNICNNSTTWKLKYVIYKLIYKLCKKADALIDTKNNFCGILIKSLQFIESIEPETDEKLQKSFTLPDGLLVYSDHGYVRASQIHETHRFNVYNITTEQDKQIYCADNHILFDENLNEVFAKDLHVGDYILTSDGKERITNIFVTNSNLRMCDITIDDELHRYYTNGILSHNTTTSGIAMLHYLLFNSDKTAMVLGNKRATAVEILKKVKDIFLELPFFLKPGVRCWNESKIGFDNNCMCMAEATTLNSGIGYTLHCVLLDEFAHLPPNIKDSFYNNIFPTISAAKARLMITSTQNGNELFCRLYTAAENGENEYAHFRTDWWEVPEWNPEKKCWEQRDENWHKMQVANFGSEENFERQFGSGFVISDTALISAKHIVENRRNVVHFKQLSDIVCEGNNFWSFNPVTFRVEDLRDNFWILTCDLAEGKQSDYTVFCLNKMHVGNCADEVNYSCEGLFRCNKKDLNECSKYLISFCETYLRQDRYLISIEYNTYGALFSKYLCDYVDKFNPRNFSKDVIIKYYNENRTKFTYGIRLTHANKQKICTLFKSAYEHGRVVNNSHIFYNEIQNFVDATGNGSYKSSFGHDDVVMAQINLIAALDTRMVKNLQEDFLISNPVAGEQPVEDLAPTSIYDALGPLTNYNSMDAYLTMKQYAEPSEDIYSQMGNAVGGENIYDMF